MRRALWVLLAAVLSACAAPASKNTTADAILKEMDTMAQESARPSKPEEVNNALLPPLAVQLPKAVAQSEARFDLAVNNTPAAQVFAAIASGTRYSILAPPSVDAGITLNLKDVTVFDALEAIRQMYGYDYRVDGTRIYIEPITIQTRIFQVNYLTGERKGESQLRVTSGSVSDNAPSSATAGATTTTPQPVNSGSSSYGVNSSKVSMSSDTDFWSELGKALRAIVGTEPGRSVVISPMSGVIVVRAMPDEIRSVEAYLKAAQVSIERQVILEAKIIDVRLNDSFQSGVNWAGFGNLKSSPNSRGSFGVVSPGASLLPNTAAGAAQSLANGTISATPGSDLTSLTQAGTGTLFGLAFQTNNFAALLNFLESQGDVHVLSSPRIATLNNQKAVLKVGTDDFFVTNVSSTITTGTATTTTPSVTLQPFFSGIALDVTPRIDEHDEIILHVHPSVSKVTTKTTTVDLGSGGGTLNLPLASSDVSETDSIVRARDGQIVAIGGLMSQETDNSNSGLPGTSKTLFGQTSKATEKHELIILLKPTVVNSDRAWTDDITRSRDRVNGLLNPQAAP